MLKKRQMIHKQAMASIANCYISRGYLRKFWRCSKDRLKGSVKDAGLNIEGNPSIYYSDTQWIPMIHHDTSENLKKYWIFYDMFMIFWYILANGYLSDLIWSDINLLVGVAMAKRYLCCPSLTPKAIWIHVLWTCLKFTYTLHIHIYTIILLYHVITNII